MAQQLSTDWIKVCTSGVTADKRPIDPQMLLDTAATYNPAHYEARIYPVHLYEWSYDRAPIGDVLALKAEQEGDVVALYAKLRPYAAMMSINARQQLCYASLEIEPEFADTGKPYLRGMALTDSPACRGLERIQLSSQQQQYTVTGQAEVQLDALAPAAEPGIFARLANSLNQFRSSPEKNPSTNTEAVMSNPDNTDALTLLTEQMGQVLTQLSALQTTEPAMPTDEPAAPSADHQDDDALTQLSARVAELEHENAALKQGEQHITHLSEQMTQVQAQLTQLSAMAPDQTPNPAGISGADDEECL